MVFRLSGLPTARALAVWAAVLCAGLVLLGGCAGAQESSSQESDNGGGGAAAPDRAATRGPRLAPARADVRTIQLYRGADEVNLPILPLRGSEQLALEFDLMAEAGRPLTVHFYHADRTWQRDLTPIEYLKSFENDNLIDYQRSQSTDVPYVHYDYRFPNDDIGFEVSGNYVVRVTEQGDEDAVLFERAFFVTEQAGPLELGIDGVIASGQSLTADRLIARFTPPAALQGDVFDYDVCFTRGVSFEEARCADRPQLAEQPALRFEMDRRAAYTARPADYVLNLGSLRGGQEIEGTDFTVRPPRILLEPDYANFAGSTIDPNLSGQVVVEGAVNDRANPDVTAEYATVQFSFVPDGERPLGGAVFVTGPLGGAGPVALTDTTTVGRLLWSAERGRYEGELLIKQGLYEYRYDSPNPALRAQLQRALPRRDARYTAFVYYSDLSAGTDRLLAVGSVQRR